MLDDLKKTLWTTVDKLRADMDAVQYKHRVPGLIFVKCNSDAFAARPTELKACLSNPADTYCNSNATPEDLVAEFKDRDYYAKVNAFWVPEAGQPRRPEGGALLKEACA